jgi:hypothetical protein
VRGPRRVEPALSTDWQRPGAAPYSATSPIYARINTGIRSRKQKCCVRDRFRWDVPAVYPPGVKWTEMLPPAVFFNGPVVKVKDDLAKAISRAGWQPAPLLLQLVAEVVDDFFAAVAADVALQAAQSHADHVAVMQLVTEILLQAQP